MSSIYPGRNGPGHRLDSCVLAGIGRNRNEVALAALSTVVDISQIQRVGTNESFLVVKSSFGKNFPGRLGDEPLCVPQPCQTFLALAKECELFACQVIAISLWKMLVKQDAPQALR